MADGFEMSRRRVAPDLLSHAWVRSVELVHERIADAGRYPFSLPALRGLNRLELHPRVTFFVGENGSGKSTLLEALAVCLGFNAEGGSRNFRFSTRSSESELHVALRLTRGSKRPEDGFFLRAESFFNVGTEIERIGDKLIDSYGGVSLHEQSHGESFMALLLHRFRGNGIYLLDEPEAALSPQRQLAMLTRMHDLAEGANSQFIIATHSPILMAYPGARIFQFGPDGVGEVAYLDTEHYRITRDFLLHPEQFLQRLFSDDDDV